MSFEQDVQLRATEKAAGLMDTLGDLIGNNGSLSTPLTALGGAALGGMAGKGLGMGGLGIGLGAALGGALGGVGANAINSQNMYQNMNDAAMINGISAGLNANDQTDMMQNQAIAQTNDTVNQLVGIVGDMMQGGMAAGGMPMDPGMGAGVDPSMMGGQPPMDPSMMGGQTPMDQGAMMPPPSAPMTGQIDNNGLGMKQGSYNGLTSKLAGLLKTAADEAAPDHPRYEDLESTNAYKNMQIPETTWLENLANSAPVSGMIDVADAIASPFNTAKNFAGDISTGLGELVNSYDPTLNAIANMETEMIPELNAYRLRDQDYRKNGIDLGKINQQFNEYDQAFKGYNPGKVVQRLNPLKPLDGAKKYNQPNLLDDAKGAYTNHELMRRDMYRDMVRDATNNLAQFMPQMQDMGRDRNAATSAMYQYIADRDADDLEKELIADDNARRAGQIGSRNFSKFGPTEDYLDAVFPPSDGGISPFARGTNMANAKGIRLFGNEPARRPDDMENGVWAGIPEEIKRLRRETPYETTSIDNVPEGGFKNIADAIIQAQKDSSTRGYQGLKNTVSNLINNYTDELGNYAYMGGYLTGLPAGKNDWEQELMDNDLDSLRNELEQQQAAPLRNVSKALLEMKLQEERAKRMQRLEAERATANSRSNWLDALGSGIENMQTGIAGFIHPTDRNYLNNINSYNRNYATGGY